jgi:penicillin-binding protein 1A
MTSAEEGKPRPKGTRLVLKVGFQAVLVLLFLSTAALGTLSGVLFAYRGDLPEISALDDYRPHTITRLLAQDGQEIGEFAIERRVVIAYDDMAPVLRQAIIATEDGGFERHFGISVSRMIITAIRDVIKGERYGASTITQQLARTLFLTEYMKDGVFARSGLTGLERKAKEILVAIQIEKRFTKREILTMYANHDVREPDQSWSGAVRRRGRNARLLRQVRQGRDARRSGGNCRHHSDPRAADSIRQS